jgi:hypothetical protein
MTIPYIALLPPVTFEQILKLEHATYKKEFDFGGDLSVTGLNIHLEYDRDTGILNLVKNGTSRFLPGEYFSASELTPKMHAFLIGKTLDYLTETPEAENCLITNIEATRVCFKHDRKPLALQDVPRHTPESFQAQQDRFWVESFLTRFKHSPSTIRIFERVFAIKGERRITSLMTASYLSRNGIIQFSGEDVGDDKVKTISINRNGGYPTVAYNNGTVVSDHKIEIDGVLPVVAQQSLNGGSFSRVLDHWIYSETEIKKNTQFKTKMRINIKDTGKQVTLIEAFPEYCGKRIALATLKEERSRTPLLSAYINEQIEKKTIVAKYLETH